MLGSDTLPYSLKNYKEGLFFLINNQLALSHLLSNFKLEGYDLENQGYFRYKGKAAILHI